MVIPEEREGKMDDDPNLSRDITPANATVANNTINTRKGGLQTKSQQKVCILVCNVVTVKYMLSEYACWLQWILSYT